jgi:hypothetical protein
MLVPMKEPTSAVIQELELAESQGRPPQLKTGLPFTLSITQFERFRRRKCLTEAWGGVGFKLFVEIPQSPWRSLDSYDASPPSRLRPTNRGLVIQNSTGPTASFCKPSADEAFPGKPVSPVEPEISPRACRRDIPARQKA